MGKKLYIISQFYSEKEGSYSSVFKALAEEAHKKGYEVKILCGKKKNQKKEENFAYCKIKRFNSIKLPAFGLIINAFFLKFQIKNYFSSRKIYKEDIFVANGEAALGAPISNLVLRAGDQPAPIFLKNLKKSNSGTSFFGRLARNIHLKIQETIESRCIEKASGIMFPSEKTRDYFCELYGCEKKPYFIPRSGVDFSKFNQGEKLPIKGKKLLFVSAGKEKIRKGVVYLERALPDLFDNYKDLKLIHVGTPFNWEVPKKYQKRIISVGKVPWKKMKNYYTTADLFINSSLSEGFPNTILEAIASGCPVVTSDIDGIKEYMVHKKEGYVFKRADADSLKKGVEYMLENTKKAKTMAKRAKKRYKKIDYSNYVSELLEFIRKKKKISINLLN